VIEEQHMIETGFGGAHPRHLTQLPDSDHDSSPDPTDDPVIGDPEVPDPTQDDPDPDPVLDDPADPPTPDPASDPGTDPNQLRRRLATQVISTGRHISFENMLGQDDTTHFNLDVTGKSWVFQFNIRFGDIATSDQSVFLYADDTPDPLGRDTYRMFNIYADQGGANTKWFYIDTLTHDATVVYEIPIREWFIPRGYSPDGEATLNGINMTVNIVFMDNDTGAAPYWHLEYHVPSMGNTEPLRIGQIEILPSERMQSLQHVRVGSQNPFLELSGMTIMTSEVDPSFFVADRLARVPSSWPY